MRDFLLLGLTLSIFALPAFAAVFRIIVMVTGRVVISVAAWTMVQLKTALHRRISNDGAPNTCGCECNTRPNLQKKT